MARPSQAGEQSGTPTTGETPGISTLPEFKSRSSSESTSSTRTQSLRTTRQRSRREPCPRGFLATLSRSKRPGASADTIRKPATSTRIGMQGLTAALGSRSGRNRTLRVTFPGAVRRKVHDEPIPRLRPHPQMAAPSLLAMPSGWRPPIFSRSSSRRFRLILAPLGHGFLVLNQHADLAFPNR